MLNSYAGNYVRSGAFRAYSYPGNYTCRNEFVVMQWVPCQRGNICLLCACADLVNSTSIIDLSRFAMTRKGKSSETAFNGCGFRFMDACVAVIARIQLMFQVSGSKGSAMVSADVLGRKNGQYLFKSLALDTDAGDRYSMSCCYLRIHKQTLVRD
jgi:hypothetical protein